ncbi:MAG: hypothetical protein LBN18_04505 [Dysgonamonadaceae bacterium]|jgi:hypothetical protein|nr:hypothetical protein [Dysgonamonadaceae bacterium]
MLHTAQPALNPAQLHFLQTLSFVKTEKTLNELKQIVSDFYYKQFTEQTNKWWDENNMTDEKLGEMLDTHYRTPYK